MNQINTLTLSRGPFYPRCIGPSQQRLLFLRPIIINPNQSLVAQIQNGVGDDARVVALVASAGDHDDGNAT